MHTAKNFLRGIFGGRDLPVDEEFEAKLRTFNDHVDKLRKVRLAMQLYADAVDAVCKAEVVLADAFDQFYKGSSLSRDDNVPPVHGVADTFKALMSEKSNVVRYSVNSILHNRCIKPVNAILAKVGPIQERIKLRKVLLQDHDNHHSTLQKEREAGKSHDDPAIQRHSIKLDEVSINLGRVVSAVDASLNDWKKARPHMLTQELAATVGCCYYLSTANISLVGRILPLLPQASSTLCLLNAIGSKKLRPSALPISKSVEIAIARKSIMGGKYGGYGTLDGQGLLVPTSPLSSREALSQQKLHSGNGDIPAHIVGSSESSGATNDTHESIASACENGDLLLFSGFTMETRAPLPTRSPSMRLHQPIVMPDIPISMMTLNEEQENEALSSDEEDSIAQFATSTSLKNESESGESTGFNKRTSIMDVKNLGLVSNRVKSHMQVPEPPPKPLKKNP